jgi:VWFA-related protein
MKFPLMLLALAAAIGTSSAQRAAVEPRSGRVFIDVVAENKDGAPALDLRPAELEVWIAGYRAPIESVSLVTATAEPSSGRSIALILDDMTVPPPLMPRAREVAQQLVGRKSPADRVSILMLSGRKFESTDSPAQLRQAIAGYGPRAVGVMRPDVLAAQVLETIAAVARDQRETSRRNAVVAIGSAWLFDTPIPPPEIGRDLRPEWTAAVRAMALASAALYVIDPGGVGMSRVNGGTSGFARDTGGFAFANTNDFGRAVDRIMRESASYYRLEVVDPPAGRQSDLREVDVRVLRRGVSVRARRAIPGDR